MDLDFLSVHKLEKKELGQYPAILTSHLVNNPYVLLAFMFIFETETENWTCNQVFDGKCLKNFL